MVGNLKGGTGKSTITFNLAIWLAHQGVHVIALDLDPQATLTDVAEIRAEEALQPLLHVQQNRSLLHTLAGNSEVLVDVGTADIDAMCLALGCADQVLIPVAPSQADIWSTQRFVRIIREIDESIGRQPRLMAFINRADTNPAISETAEAEAALDLLPGIERLDTRLSQRTDFRRSLSEGMAVFEMEPGCKAAVEFAQLAHRVFPATPGLPPAMRQG
ncbi:AAA family ATPase [Thiorhodospira sibirica]|uniref:nucleotide-binding protein n=1 Tax=Thiorhodospira sibirica TaxID=154347 RepID=UPI000313BEC9